MLLINADILNYFYRLLPYTCICVYKRTYILDTIFNFLKFNNVCYTKYLWTFPQIVKYYLVW